MDIVELYLRLFRISHRSFLQFVDSNQFL